MKEFIEVANNLEISGLSDFGSYSEVSQDNQAENHEVTHFKDMPMSLEVDDAVDDRKKEAQSKTPSLSMEEDVNEHCDEASSRY